MLRTALLALFSIALIGLSGCGDSDGAFSLGLDQEIVGSGERTYETKATPAQRAETRRILASDEFLQSVIDEAGGGGYRIETYSPGSDYFGRFMGVTAEIRPYKPLNVTRRHFPTVCFTEAGYMRLTGGWHYKKARTLDIFVNLNDDRIDDYEFQLGHGVGPEPKLPAECKAAEKLNLNE